MQCKDHHRGAPVLPHVEQPVPTPWGVSSAAFFAADQRDVSQVDYEAYRLAEDEHRIAPVDRVAEEDQPAADGEIPEGHRDDRAPGSALCLMIPSWSTRSAC